MEQTAVTEVDRLATLATELDRFVAGIEDKPTLTVAIHLFLSLTRKSHAIDLATLSRETNLSRRTVKHALYALTLTGRLERIGHGNPRRYKLINGKQLTYLVEKGR